MDRDLNNNSSSTPGLKLSHALIALVLLLGVVVIVLAATLMNNRSEARLAASGALASEPSLAAAPTIAPFTALPASASRSDKALESAKLGNQTGKSSGPSSNNSSNNSSNPQSNTQASNVAVPLPSRQSAAACQTCGTVENVRSEQRQGQVNGVAVGGETIGLGTLAGGILGGLLGNQVGGGRGNTAATVLGVAGGAYAGNTVEKNMKKVTVYLVRVRMDDGSIRNMEISSDVSVGAKVVVEGRNLRLANSAG